MSTLGEQLHRLANELPSDATWDDMIEYARFRKAVQEGIDAADRGEFASDEDVRRAFRKWGWTLLLGLCETRPYLGVCRLRGEAVGIFVCGMVGRIVSDGRRYHHVRHSGR